MQFDSESIQKGCKADKLSRNLENSCPLNIRIGNSASSANSSFVFKLNDIWNYLFLNELKFTSYFEEVKNK